MTELEKHRKTWQGKSDEWLFERLALELKDKVETIHQLLAENDRLRIDNGVCISEQLNCDHKWKVEAFDCYGMPYEQYCEHCGKKKAI